MNFVSFSKKGREAGTCMKKDYTLYIMSLLYLSVYSLDRKPGSNDDSIKMKVNLIHSGISALLRYLSSCFICIFPFSTSNKKRENMCRRRRHIIRETAAKQQHIIERSVMNCHVMQFKGRQHENVPCM